MEFAAGKPTRLLFFFLFCGALGAQAPTPLADGSVALARGNTPGEQHHHLVLENSYVRAYNVIVPAHESTLLHHHDEDYVYVAMGPADVLNAVLDKPEIHVQLKDGDVRFARGGFSHVARNLSDAPFHNVTIALLRSQGAVRNLCEKIVEGPLGDCDTELDVKDRQGVGPIGYKARGWFETEEVRAGLATLDGGSSHGDAASGFDRLLVVLAGGELEVMSPGKPAAMLHGSDALWLPAGLAFTFTNRAPGPSRFLMLSFKDSAASKSASNPWSGRQALLPPRSEQSSEYFFDAFTSPLPIVSAGTHNRTQLP
jgi:hypothetical protein